MSFVYFAVRQLPGAGGLDTPAWRD